MQFIYDFLIVSANPGIEHQETSEIN